MSRPQRFPRLFSWLLAAVALIAALAIISPQQLPIALYKLCLISLAGVVAYWFDRALFPYARPDSYLEVHWQDGTSEPLFDADYRVVPGYQLVFAVAMVRRALVVLAIIVGVALGM